MEIGKWRLENSNVISPSKLNRTADYGLLINEGLLIHFPGKDGLGKRGNNFCKEGNRRRLKQGICRHSSSLYRECKSGKNFLFQDQFLQYFLHYIHKAFYGGHRGGGGRS